MNFSAEETERFSRHLLLDEVGFLGQKKIRDARVLIVGVGGLGTVAALYLARSGVGTIGLVDFDQVSLSNLHRQILFDNDSVGRSKIEVGAKKLRDSCASIKVETYPEKFSLDFANRNFSRFDLVLDCTDNFSVRYLINDAAIQYRMPIIFGSVFRFEGQVTVFDSERGPCLRCFFPKSARPTSVPSCAEAGVVGVLPGIIGILQATEALKIILSIGETLIGRILFYDALKMSFRTLRLEKKPDCPHCGPKTIHQKNELSDVSEANILMSGISPEHLKTQIDQKGQRAIRIIDVRSAAERMICKIEGSDHYPLSDISKLKDRYSPDQPLVLYCKSGLRSQKAKQVLVSEGFINVESLDGGILGWIERVDPSLPRY